MSFRAKSLRCPSCWAIIVYARDCLPRASIDRLLKRHKCKGAE